MNFKGSSYWNSGQIVFLPSEKGSIVKRKHLLPLGKSFLLEETPFQNVLGMKKKKKKKKKSKVEVKKKKVLSLVEDGGKSIKCIQPSEVQFHFPYDFQ